MMDDIFYMTLSSIFTLANLWLNSYIHNYDITKSDVYREIQQKNLRSHVMDYIYIYISYGVVTPILENFSQIIMCDLFRHKIILFEFGVFVINLSRNPTHNV